MKPRSAESEPERELNAIFVASDRQHFGGKLAAAGWHAAIAALRQGHYGSACYETRQIVVAEHSLCDPAKTRKTLLHEMIHASLWLAQDRSHQRRNESHGVAFAAEVARIVAAGEDMNGENQFMTCASTSAERLQIAVDKFLARRARREYPDGRCDGGGRWFPSAREEQVCCARLRRPSRAFRFGLLQHCCTIAHVSRLCGVDTVTLRDAIKSNTASVRGDRPIGGGVAK